MSVGKVGGEESAIDSVQACSYMLVRSLPVQGLIPVLYCIVRGVWVQFCASGIVEVPLAGVNGVGCWRSDTVGADSLSLRRSQPTYTIPSPIKSSQGKQARNTIRCPTHRNTATASLTSYSRGYAHAHRQWVIRAPAAAIGANRSPPKLSGSPTD